MKTSRWKIYFTLLLIIGSIIIILPSFVDVDKLPYWTTKVLSEKKIKLGLDLQGGLHLVLGVEVDKVVNENTDRFIERIKEQLKDGKIDFDSTARVSEGSEFFIKFKNIDDADKIKKLVAAHSVIRYLTSYPLELRYDFSDEYKKSIKDRAVNQTIEAIRNRIDEFGVNEPSIQAQGSDKIIIQLPGIKDPGRAKGVIGKTAKLEFKLVIEDDNFTPVKLNELIKEADDAGTKYDDKVITYNEYVNKLNEFLAAKLPADGYILFERAENKETGTKGMLPYLVEKTATVTGDHLADAYVSFDSTTNEPFVSFELNAIGAKFFEELTGKNIGKKLAIILDNTIFSAPVVQSKIGSQGRITMGRSRSLNSMQTEAEDLALVLRAGALPAQLTFEEERVVGPSLGADSIKQGSTAMFLGSFMVFLFMLIYYRKAGLIADTALFLNVAFILSSLILLEATLTLPGIAGIALTVGMAVDANIIIFERIREELRNGNSAKASIESGFDKALSTILDSNITTAIAGIVLLQYGTGPIKGFAVTLLIGIFFTVFTAVFISKWIFRALINRINFKTISI